MSSSESNDETLSDIFKSNNGPMIDYLDNDDLTLSKKTQEPTSSILDLNELGQIEKPDDELINLDGVNVDNFSISSSSSSGAGASSSCCSKRHICNDLEDDKSMDIPSLDGLDLKDDFMDSLNQLPNSEFKKEHFDICPSKEIDHDGN